MNKHYILAAALLRVCIALATRTFFQPDEYFQSLEVAHHAVFGYGHLTWEWLSPKPIRSILYPALNIPVYWLLKISGLDDTMLLIWLPKVLHGLLASLTDIWLCRLTRRIVGARYVVAAAFFSLTSLFHGMSLSRSMSNSLETSLTTVALSYFPWELTGSTWRADLRKSLRAAALACAVRPTNAVLWIYVMVTLLWQLRNSGRQLISVLRDVLVVGITSVALLGVLDSLYYGSPTFTPLNFVLTNLSSVSLFYGSSPWHYYLTQGIPILCTTSLPFILHGVWLSTGSTGTAAVKKMLGLIVWTLSCYSLAGHKEWRFIHPLLPLFHILAARSVVDLYQRQATSKGGSRQFYQRPVVRICAALVLLNLAPWLYLAQAHERAQIDVLYYLKSLPPDEVTSVGFLMPCHSTPWQSYLHRPAMADSARFWALGCEPPLSGQNITEYRDQTDVFYESPIIYLRTRFPASLDLSFPPSPVPFSKPGQGPSEHAWKHEWPEYLVAFGALTEEVEVGQYITQVGYGRVWHADRGYEGDPRRRGGITVWRAAPRRRV